MRDLIILACNAGAKNGDYLTGTLWNKFYPPLKSKAKFAAVDSIITLLNNDGQGALVLYPEEMNRVKGFDVKATLEMFNPQKKIGLDRLKKHTEAIKQGILRIFPKYDHVYVALNLEVYKMCMFAAITETNQWHKVTFYETLAAAWNQTKILDQLQHDIALGQPMHIVRVPEKVGIKSKYLKRWTEFRKHTPERWQYWK